MRFAVIAYMQIVEKADATAAERANFSGSDSGPIPAITPGTIDLRTTLAAAKLERHLEWYAQNGFASVTLDEVVEGKVADSRDPALAAAAAAAVGPKRLALTFDGGFESHYRLVFPLLQKYNMRATFFVPRDTLDKPGGLSRGELEIMAKWGMGLGILVPPAEQVLQMLPPALGPELSVPRRDLEQWVGRPIFLAATQARHVEGPFLRTMRVHDYRGVAISEMGNHMAKEGMVVLARYFHRKNVKVDEWKDVARLAMAGPAKNAFYLRT